MKKVWRAKKNSSDSDSDVVSEEKQVKMLTKVLIHKKNSDESEEDNDEILDSNGDNSEFVEEENSNDSSEQNDNLKVEEKVSSDEEELWQRLEKSRKGFGAMINSLLANFRHVDEDFFEELEETLIEADVGFETAMKISDELRQEVKLRNAKRKMRFLMQLLLVEIYENEGKEEDNNLHFSSEDQQFFFSWVLMVW